jgi:muconolactone delta-isomerase
MSKFLILWSLEPALLGQEAVKAVFSMPTYAEKLIKDGKLDKRYHLVGKHGGAWIYNVESNEELDRLLALAPVYNFARYDVYPLAEMKDPSTVANSSDSLKSVK